MSTSLKRWADSDKTILVYVDSITTLLQFVELNDAYLFLHLLSGRVESVDGQSVYRLDPAAHDKQTLVTLRSLMDDALEVTPSSG